MKIRVLLLFIMCVFSVSAQTEFKFRVWLKDKNGTACSLDRPGEFLSAKALSRRHRQGLMLDSTDLPVSKKYLNGLSALGVKVVSYSKWMNTAVVAMADSNVMRSVRSLPFVVNTEWVWQGTTGANPSSLRNETFEDQSNSPSLFQEYGYGYQQLAVSNGHLLHEAGFRGQGKTIAVIDAGFLKADSIAAYRHLQILGARDFVYPRQNVYKADRHGQMVLSVMGAVDSFRFIGSAPKASYWLLRSEDTSSEYPVEEDYWAAAAEFADSVGVDIINTSLGYSTFEQSVMNHTHQQLDGKTIFVTRAASCATQKGIFVIISAGNEGNKIWQKINAPGDAADVLTVGSISSSLQVSTFSSVGFTEDNRVKPDVVAVGEGTYLMDGTGKLNTSNGTSFSAPLMSGLVACLWQALPDLKARDLLGLIRRFSTFYTLPDVHYGYGVPDMMAAFRSISNNSGFTRIYKPDVFFKNKKGTGLVIKNIPPSDSLYLLRIYAIDGRMELGEKLEAGENFVDTRHLTKGVHIVFIEGKNYRYSTKVIK
jgi:subtilisin family serine protease